VVFIASFSLVLEPRCTAAVSSRDGQRLVRENHIARLRANFGRIVQRTVPA
jgi:hypothetical protein